MKIRRIRHKLMLAIAAALSLGFIVVAYHYNRVVEESIISEYERTLHRLTDSVVMSIETIMTENHAEIMPEYARRLKVLPGLMDFRIARIDGTEAYTDNKTILAVNARLGEQAFPPRASAAETKRIFAADDPAILKVLAGTEKILRVKKSVGLENRVEFFDTIPANKTCHRCHGSDETVRGIIKVTASLAEVEREMAQARLKSLAILILSLAVTMSITGYMLGRSVAGPIELVTHAMTRFSSGDFSSQVVTERKDELGTMANSFNKMTTDLRQNYGDMLREQEKLTTVIRGAGEAVVVADASGKVVLANEAACELLGKTEEQIRQDGILGLVDRPDSLRAMLESAGDDHEPVLIEHRERWLLTSASTIRDNEGRVIGSAALLRDVSKEQRMLRELTRLSTTDALTNVYNRRHLDATLKNELGRAQQVGLALSVIMFDADHFKKFNDTYGHDQGDRVLKMVGQVMNDAVREYDVPCRYGGEEFIVILPSTDAAGALSVAERLRTDVEAMRVDGLKVTISLGIATYPDVPATTPEALIAAADAALYRSKENGRNCSTVAIRTDISTPSA